MFYIGLYRENVKKNFLSETTRPRALGFSITKWTSANFFSNNAPGVKKGPAWGRMFYVALYRENKKKSSETTTPAAFIFVM